ncbi:MAG: hypothetical protein AYK19_18780 [Theionarchaea archaeon DG-70-1]|nr:MAG: hypothetical protein AYK19_18780 [Theionarchaea archaeon DG-70-1]
MHRNSYTSDRITRYVQRLDQSRRELKESIEKAEKYKISRKFVNEASSLVYQFPRHSYDLVECTQEVTQYITRTEAFINRWESEGTTPGYHEVLRYARKNLTDLKTLKLVLDDITEKTLGPLSRTEAGASMRSIFPVSVAIIVGAVILLTALIVVVLLQ